MTKDLSSDLAALIEMEGEAPIGEYHEILKGAPEQFAYMERAGGLEQDRALWKFYLAAKNFISQHGKALQGMVAGDGPTSFPVANSRNGEPGANASEGVTGGESAATALTDEEILRLANCHALRLFKGEIVFNGDTMKVFARAIIAQSKGVTEAGDVAEYPMNLIEEIMSSLTSIQAVTSTSGIAKDVHLHQKASGAVYYLTCLRDALAQSAATARREGMERAAKICGAVEPQGKNEHDGAQFMDGTSACETAIRKAITEGDKANPEYDPEQHDGPNGPWSIPS